MYTVVNVNHAVSIVGYLTLATKGTSIDTKLVEYCMLSFGSIRTLFSIFNSVLCSRIHHQQSKTKDSFLE